MNTPPRPVDLAIVARWVIPIEPRDTVLEHHAVVVDQGKIVDLLPAADLSARYAPRQRVDRPGHALMPGLVNLHAHAAMSLLRGVGDDMPLMQWLNERIWPLEAALVSDAFVYDGTLLAGMEMLRGGTTTCSDMYFFPEAAGRAFVELGMRAVLGAPVMEFPTAYAATPQEYIEKGLATRDRFKDEPLLGFTIAPHAPYTVSDPVFEQVVTLANELELPIHIHVHETAQEVQDSLAQYGVRPLARLQRLGLVGPQLIAVHAVHLDQHEIELLAQFNASVAHCPTSNLKLASGVAPVAAMEAAGLNVGIGTDGAASNNRLDMLSELRLAALLAKGASGDPTAFSAHTALRAATLNGACALGMGDRIGSIEPGKEADLIALDLSSPECQPLFHAASQIAYVAGREQVSDVWVGGQGVVCERQLVQLDRWNAVEEKVATWRENALERSREPRQKHP
jgi:5-methylthioadenosine/S-adenosylhomocysteine deaminase